MRPGIERRKRGPGQGHRASESTDKNANEHRLIESGTQAQVVDLDDIRFQRAVAQLHRLGERPLYEMLVEFAARRLLRTEIEAAVNCFAAIDPALLVAAGGRDLAPIPLYVEIAP